jgi:3-isopropylmalate dehydrogenase
MKLAVIAGDGIGPEVIGEALKVLEAVAPGVEKTEYDLGARRYHATGETLPDGVVDELKGHDASNAAFCSRCAFNSTTT